MKKVHFTNTRVKARIAFIGNFQYNCGSSNTLLEYIRTGTALGYDIRISEFGYIDDIVRAAVPIAKRSWQSDLFVIVYETYPFLSQSDIEQICAHVPRSKRIIIDPDGKYSEPCFNSGDTNHSTSASYKYWTKLYDSLSDTILQPFLGAVPTSKVHSFLYFGMSQGIPKSRPKPKNFDLLYVGTNWYRWHDICSLIKVIAPIRSHLKRVAIVGDYWSEKIMLNYEEATYSDPAFLKQNNIELYESAPYGAVEETMSTGLLHPILVRPILNALGFVTPRMFETFAADTVPLIPQYFAHAPKLYGNDVTKLTLSNDPANDILRILENYEVYQKLSRDIRETLKTTHSYKARIHQLLKFA